MSNREKYGAILFVVLLIVFAVAIIITTNRPRGNARDFEDSAVVDQMHETYRYNQENK